MGVSSYSTVLNNGFRFPENKHGCQWLKKSSENGITLCVGTKYFMIIVF